MLNELLEKLSAITAEAEAMLKAAATAADVENAKNKLTGRNGWCAADWGIQPRSSACCM